jgi:flagellar basal-body rod protein FlgC
MFKAMDISTTGLVAQRIRMDVIAGNIAMAEVTEDAQGRAIPYRRQYPVFQAGSAVGKNQGVSVARVEKDMSEFDMKYDPGHRNAIQDGPNAGWVRYPNIDLPTEHINALEAARAYEANLSAYQVSKAMMTNALRILA